MPAGYYVLHREQPSARDCRWSRDEVMQRAVTDTPSLLATCLGKIGGHNGRLQLLTGDSNRLISGIAVTLPSCYFLWPEASHGDAHGAHGHDEEHGEEHEEGAEDAKEESQDDAAEEPKEDESKDEQPKEDETKDEEPKQDDSKQDESKDDDSKQDDSKPDSSSKSGKPDTTEPEKTSNRTVDGVQFKGKTAAGDENNEMTDTRKREPDSKGAFKKRIDSGYQKDLGPGPEKAEDGRSAVRWPLTHLLSI